MSIFHGPFTILAFIKSTLFANPLLLQRGRIQKSWGAAGLLKFSLLTALLGSDCYIRVFEHILEYSWRGSALPFQSWGALAPLDPTFFRRCPPYQSHMITIVYTQAYIQFYPLPLVYSLQSHVKTENWKYSIRHKSLYLH